MLRIEDDEGRLHTLRQKQMRRRRRKKKSQRQLKQELVVVRTPYGEARFYKNSDGTRSKVKLKRKKPSSPVGMESRPVLFNDKANLKEIKEQDSIEVA